MKMDLSHIDWLTFYDLPGEEWRCVVEWEGEYEVSSIGRVRHVHKRQRPLRFGKSNSGYFGVTLSRQRVHVHQLVARAFIGECPKGHQVNHIDGDKLNNLASNLEYLTPQENVRHYWRRIKASSEVFNMSHGAGRKPRYRLPRQ
jgi:hypothetical protein